MLAAVGSFCPQSVWGTRTFSKGEMLRPSSVTIHRWTCIVYAAHKSSRVPRKRNILCVVSGAFFRFAFNTLECWRWIAGKVDDFDLYRGKPIWFTRSREVENDDELKRAIFCAHSYRIMMRMESNLNINNGLILLLPMVNCTRRNVYNRISAIMFFGRNWEVKPHYKKQTKCFSFVWVLTIEKHQTIHCKVNKRLKCVTRNFYTLLYNFTKVQRMQFSCSSLLALSSVHASVSFLLLLYAFHITAIPSCFLSRLWNPSTPLALTWARKPNKVYWFHHSQIKSF